MASANNSLLLDTVLACSRPPCEKAGYLIDYKVIDARKGKYIATARPVRYGDTGTASLYTDETGIIRITRDNRPATADDPPLQ